MNLILQAMAEEDRLLLENSMTSVEIPRGEILFETGSKIDRIHFIDSGVVSLVALFSDGTTSEITTVGREGFVNVGSLLDDDLAIARHTMQVAGSVRWINSDVLRHYVAGSETLRGLLHRYAQTLIAQISQTVACNNLHNANQRLARWLLMTHDRVEGDELGLTQEFLAEMLGVRRPTVSELAQVLQEDGLIRYSRGRITILDRAGLEARCCECHSIMDAHFRRLLPELARTEKPGR